jgi:hypothetical protein
MKKSAQEKREEIITIIRNWSDDQIIALWNQKCMFDNPNGMIYDIENFDEVCKDFINENGALELVRITKNKLFDPNDAWWWFDEETGDIYSANYLEESEHCPLKDLNDCADYLINHFDDCDGIWDDTDTDRLKMRFEETHPGIDLDKFDELMDSYMYSIVEDDWDEIAKKCRKTR